MFALVTMFGDPASRARFGARPLAVCALLLVATVAVAIVGLAAGTSEPSSSALPGNAAPKPARSTPSGVASPTAHELPSSAAAALDWVVAELPRKSSIVADRRSATMLTGRFAGVWTPAALAADPPTEITAVTDYVVTTAGLRAAAASSSPIRNVLSSSLPVAVFGSGPDSTTVRRVVTAPVAQVTAQRADARTNRRRAETQLLANPAVTVNDGARRRLGDGALDLSAATVLALMAARGRVEIVGIVAVPAESAAGMPARTVDLRTSAAPLAVLDGLPAGFEPEASVAGPGGVHRVTWRFSPDFTRTGN